MKSNLRKYITVIVVILLVLKSGYCQIPDDFYNKLMVPTTIQATDYICLDRNLLFRNYHPRNSDYWAYTTSPKPISIFHGQYYELLYPMFNTNHKDSITIHALYSLDEEVFGLRQDTITKTPHQISISYKNRIYRTEEFINFSNRGDTTHISGYTIHKSKLLNSSDTSNFFGLNLIHSYKDSLLIEAKIKFIDQSKQVFIINYHYDNDKNLSQELRTQYNPTNNKIDTLSLINYIYTENDGLKKIQKNWIISMKDTLSRYTEIYQYNRQKKLTHYSLVKLDSFRKKVSYTYDGNTAYIISEKHYYKDLIEHEIEENHIGYEHNKENIKFVRNPNASSMFKYRWILKSK